MHHIGIDVHKKESQICILDPQGKLLSETRVPTSRSHLADGLRPYPGARVLIEASTESEWVARHIESLGLSVIVANPNFAPMYATRSKKIKTDKRDARALAQACHLGAYRPAHRLSDDQRHVRARLDVRQRLVRTRTQFINQASTLLRRQGFRIASGSAEAFLDRLAALDLPAELHAELQPLVQLLPPLNAQIAALETDLARRAQKDPVAHRLCSVPHVGPITALAFVSVIDQADRFASAHQVQSYLGLVPRESSSGEKQNRGHITKAGSCRVRSLLIQAALSTRRLKKAEAEPLWRWAEGVAHRRGKRVATVALARRLAGVLWAMMRDGTLYRRSVVQTDRAAA